MAKCASITAKGTQCKGLVKPGNEYCPAHDPSRVEARKVSASKSGRSRAGSELHGIKTTLIKLADDVMAKRADRGNAAVAATLLATAIKAVEAEMRVKEVIESRLVETQLRVEEQREIVQRMEELEQVLQKKEGSRWGA